MDLFYCHVGIGNFGDDMNAWFWDEVLPNYSDIRSGTTMFGIGSILWNSNIQKFSRILVAGSGVGVGVLPRPIPRHLEYAWVRGPLTARKLGIDASHAITDPAYLVAGMDRFSAARDQQMSGVFIPHCGTSTLPLDWDVVSESAGLEYLSPCEESVSVISRIASAEFVVTESLHGAIIADAFQKPWYPVSISPKFTPFKWQDWTQAMGVDLRVTTSLGSLKRAYSFIKQMQRFGAFLKSPRNRYDPSKDTTIDLPNTDMVNPRTEYDLSAGDKDRIRKLVARHARTVEGLLSRDLIAARNGHPHLSSAAQVDSKVSEMQEVLERLRKEVPK